MAFELRKEQQADDLEVSLGVEAASADEEELLPAAPEPSPPRWRRLEVLAGLSDEEAAATAVRLAQLWASDEPGLDSDGELLDAIHDEGGHEAFVGFLCSFDGYAKQVGACLATVAFLTASTDAIRKATRYKAKEITATADEINDAVFDGRLDVARDRAVEALTFLWKSLEQSKKRSKFAAHLRSNSTDLQIRAAELLDLHGVEAPDATRTA